MRCLYLTQEFAPLFSEGGLGVTSGSLPAALARFHAWQHDIVLPFYPWLVEQHGLLTEEVAHLGERTVGGRRADATVHRLLGHGGPCDIFLIRSDAWYDRSGIYRDEQYVPFADEVARAAFFGQCVADWVGISGVSYDVVHGNDWQSGAAIAHLRDRMPGLPILLSLLSAFYQGEFDSLRLPEMGLPPAQATALRQCAGQDRMSMLLLGVLGSDAVVACSSGYADELMRQYRDTPFGLALDEGGLAGIVLGVDYRVWDPAAKGRPTVPFDSAGVAEGKRLNKGALQRALRLVESDSVPVIGVCSRLVPEKGSDLLLEALAAHIGAGLLQLVLIGPATGDVRSRLEQLSNDSPGWISWTPHFDQDRAWLAYAGSDFTLMPSLVEPCGLNQLISYRYGTLPIVHAVGGLKDTVADLFEAPGVGTGIRLPDLTIRGLRTTVDKALNWLADAPEEVNAVRRRAMAQDWSWAYTAQHYAALYARISERG